MCNRFFFVTAAAQVKWKLDSKVRIAIAIDARSRG